MATATGEEPSTIEDVYEPYLIQLGFISRTPRGRVALKTAYEHLKLPLSAEKVKFIEMIEKGDSENA